MEMKRCEKGHFYDVKKSAICPFCNNDASSNPINLTVPVRDEDNNSVILTKPDETINRGGASSMPNTKPKDVTFPGDSVQDNDGRTREQIEADTGIDPVVGWLVCVEGPDKGRDYRVHAQRNFIGRAENMNICIRGDNTISRDTHAILSYDPRKNTYRLYQGVSRGIVYVNDEEVVTPIELKPYDTIFIGKTKLMFMPFYWDKFKCE